MAGYNPYTAGRRSYGMGMRSAPNTGAVSSMSGYRKRDRMAAAKRNLLLQQMQTKDKRRYNRM